MSLSDDKVVEGLDREGFAERHLAVNQLEPLFAYPRSWRMPPGFMNARSAPADVTV
jgi:hypothetical protein